MLVGLNVHEDDAEGTRPRARSPRGMTGSSKSTACFRPGQPLSESLRPGCVFSGGAGTEQRLGRDGAGKRGGCRSGAAAGVEVWLAEVGDELR